MSIGLDPTSFHVDYAVLNLQCAFYLKKAATRNDDALPLKQIRRNDDVGNSCFVFK